MGEFQSARTLLIYYAMLCDRLVSGGHGVRESVDVGPPNRSHLMPEGDYQCLLSHWHPSRCLVLTRVDNDIHRVRGWYLFVKDLITGLHVNG